MPLYQYRCQDCGATRELFRPSELRDMAPTWCMACAEFMSRVITPAHLHGSPNMPNG